MKRSLLSVCTGTILFISAAVLVAVTMAAPVHAQSSLTRISVDNLTNTDSDHKTEVEPDTFAWGNTIVSAFHVGRRPGSIGWGSADVGFRLPPMAA
jgi:hypothetical protein